MLADTSASLLLKMAVTKILTAHVVSLAGTPTSQRSGAGNLQGLGFLCLASLAYFLVGSSQLFLQDAASLQGNTKALPHLRQVKEEFLTFTSV